MSKEMEHGWYVVRCFSSHEKKVKEFLEREIEEQGLEDKVKEILIPTETVVEIRSGKKRTREKNFFPGYILLNAHYDEEVNNLVDSAPSCLGFLKVGKSQTVPTPLKKHEVQRIIGRVREGGEEARNIEIPYSEGDLVKVISGPFKDFDGTVQEVNTERLKLRVLVSIFGRKTPVEVHVNQVESAT
ncbi:transcription termination/antitermination protein NusG [Gracilimonas mengyeensis]|nr:transcription termination/antitermination protein NusG [Gracilimonas mengyeensis]